MGTGSADGGLATARDGDAALLALFEELALRAGRAVMAVYGTDFATSRKADASPVTDADQAAERIILSGLRDALPGMCCVAEEEMAAGASPEAAREFVLVDPLDGTREFVGRNGDFTVNIALVRDGVPAIGVVFAPVCGALYGGRSGEAWQARVSEDFRPVPRRAIAVAAPARPPRIVASRSHRTPLTDAFIARYPGATTTAVGSSLKFCLLAAGEADLYPRYGRTMEWDTAAGDAVLRAAGGMTRDLAGKPLRYGKRGRAGEPDFANPDFIASGGA